MNAIERFGPWWGLAVVPSVFLGGLSLAYALVSLACRTGAHGLVHLAPAGELGAELLGLALSVYCLLRLRRAGHAGATESRRFLVVLSLGSVCLFLLATLVQWYVAAAVSPCVA
jgi:hypothetical protein